MQLEQLLDALSGIMYRVNKKEEKKTAKEIKKELFTVEMKVAQIKDALLLSDKVRFTDLFGGMATKEEVITTFMALLELLKLQIIKVEQNEAFCDIDITRADKFGQSNNNSIDDGIVVESQNGIDANEDSANNDNNES